MEKMLTCLDCHETGEHVRMTTTPDRRDFKMFPRCNDCHEERIKRAHRTMHRYPEAFMGGDPFDDCDW